MKKLLFPLIYLFSKDKTACLLKHSEGITNTFKKMADALHEANENMKYRMARNRQKIQEMDRANNYMDEQVFRNQRTMDRLNNITSDDVPAIPIVRTSRELTQDEVNRSSVQG